MPTDQNAVPLPPAPPAPPEPPIGKIVDPAAGAPKLVQQASASDLAKFAPPPPLPPLSAAPAILSETLHAPDMPTQLPGSTPEMPLYQGGDTLRGLGTTLQPDTSGRVEVIDPPPAEPVAKKFHELGERTQAELKAGWKAKNPGKEFPTDWVEPIMAPPTAQHDPRAPLPEPAHDAVVQVAGAPVKVSQRTLDEMAAGKARSAAIKEETGRVRALQARLNSEALARQEGPKASDMDYVESR